MPTLYVIEWLLEMELLTEKILMKEITEQNSGNKSQKKLEIWMQILLKV
jgi:hypothetical protein